MQSKEKRADEESCTAKCRVLEADEEETESSPANMTEIRTVLGRIAASVMEMCGRRRERVGIKDEDPNLLLDVRRFCY